MQLPLAWGAPDAALAHPWSPWQRLADEYGVSKVLGGYTKVVLSCLKSPYGLPIVATSSHVDPSCQPLILHTHTATGTRQRGTPCTTPLLERRPSWSLLQRHRQASWWAIELAAQARQGRPQCIQPLRVQENKAGSILQFLKPLGTGNSKGPKALAASAAKEGAAAAKPLQPLRPLLPTGRKPDAAVGSKPAGSKLKRRFDSQGFDFGADAIGDTSRKEADPKPRCQQQQPCQHVQLATKPKAPSAVLQRLVVRAANKAQGGQSDSSDGIEDSDSEDAAGASAHGWGKEQKGHQQQPRNLKQQVVDWEDEEPEEEGKSGAAAGDARATATDDQECWKRAAEDEPDWEEADGQESEDASEEDEDSKKNRHQQHQRGRKRAATAESASDWAPESADSDSDSEDTGSLPGEARQQARDRVKRGVRPAKPAITAAVHAVTRVALASTFGSGVRKQTGVAAGGAAATGGEMVKQEVEEALLAAVAATAEAKAARGKKRKGPAAAELPLMLPAGKPAVGLAGSLPAAGWVASYCHGSLAFSASDPIRMYRFPAPHPASPACSPGHTPRACPAAVRGAGPPAQPGGRLGWVGGRAHQVSTIRQPRSVHAVVLCWLLPLTGQLCPSVSVQAPSGVWRWSGAVGRRRRCSWI